MAKKPKWGVNNYVKKAKQKRFRHKKRMNKDENRAYQRYRGQGK